jgi:hypothetical protein
MGKNSAPNLLLCPHCGQYHPIDGKFCPVSGKMLTPSNPTCPNCGKATKEEWSRCPYCAFPLQEQVSTTIQPGLTGHTLALLIIPVAFLVVLGLIWGAFFYRPNQKVGLEQTITPTAIVSVLEEGKLSQSPQPFPSSTSPPAPTSTLTPTVSETIAPLSTPTQINTPTPTTTRTPTFTSTVPLPTGPWEACPGSYLSRLHVGDLASVSLDPPLPNRVRSEAGTGGRILGQIQPGEEVQILEGPGCENGWVWWKVRSLKTRLEGWTAEGDNQDYWLAPVEQRSMVILAIGHEVVQIGSFASVYLRYDPAKWEPYNEFGGQVQFNNQNEAVYALQHIMIPDCIVHDNLGFGPPSTWQRQDNNLRIGNLEYRVEAWTDKTTQNTVLVVFQYPAGGSGNGKRIELKIERDAEGCIADAVEVLALSEDLITSNSP